MLSKVLSPYRAFAKWFTPTHEWIDINGNIGTVGITNFAAHHLGDIVYVEIKENKVVKAGESIGEIESAKETLEIYSPMNGKVIEVNRDISENPEIINQSAERRGWLCKMELTNPEDTSKLMDNQAYRDKIKIL